MKKFLFFVVLLAAFLASGCAVRSGGGRFRSFSLTPPLLTVVIINNVNIPIEVLENGETVGEKDATGQWRNVVVPPGGVISRGYYNFMGSRQVVLTVRGVCPPYPPDVEKPMGSCTPGQYLGTDSRTFWIHTDGHYRTEQWEVNYLRGFRGIR